MSLLKQTEGVEEFLRKEFSEVILGDVEAKHFEEDVLAHSQAELFVEHELWGWEHSEEGLNNSLDKDEGVLLHELLILTVLAEEQTVLLHKQLPQEVLVVKESYAYFFLISLLELKGK